MEKFVFRNEPIRNKNCLWWPCLLTDRDEMSNFYRGPSIDASYQVSVHLAKRFRRRFKKIDQSESRIACGAMFVNRSGQNEQSLERTFHRCFLPSFSSYGREVSEEKIKMQKVNGWRTRRRTPSDGKSSHCLWQGELKRRLTILFSTGRIIFANLPNLGKLNALFFMSAYTSVDCFFGRGYTKDLDFQHHIS